MSVVWCMEAPHDFERRRRVVLLRSGYVARCSARQTLWFDCIWAETPSNIFSGPALRRDTSLQVHRRTFLGGSHRIGQGVLTFVVSVVHAFGVVTTQTMGLSRGPSHVSTLLLSPLRAVCDCRLRSWVSLVSNPQSVICSSLCSPLTLCRLLVLHSPPLLLRPRQPISPVDAVA